MTMTVSPAPMCVGEEDMFRTIRGTENSQLENQKQVCE